MPLKPNARPWTIQEQIIEDAVTGLTLQFEVVPDGTCRLRIYGDLPFGNRDLAFDAEGKMTGTGTAVAGLCRAAWLADPSDL